AERLNPAERHQRPRVGLEHLVQISRIIVPGSLEGGERAPQEPFDHQVLLPVAMTPPAEGDHAIQIASAGGRKTAGTSTSSWSAASRPVAASKRCVSAWTARNAAPICTAGRAAGRIANHMSAAPQTR